MPLPGRLPAPSSSLDDTASSLGQGEETKPLAAVPRVSTTPRRQFISSIISPLAFDRIPGLVPSSASGPSAAAPASSALQVPVPHEAAGLSGPIPASIMSMPAPPKPPQVPLFDFTQLPGYAGPGRNAVVSNAKASSSRAGS